MPEDGASLLTHSNMSFSNFVYSEMEQPMFRHLDACYQRHGLMCLQGSAQFIHCELSKIIAFHNGRYHRIEPRVLLLHRLELLMKSVEFHGDNLGAALVLCLQDVPGLLGGLSFG
ncbi:hypothetical protein DsansV1_C18g0149191 [Dioscorea sansibarensis]